jgi:hypothetical protein
MTSGQDPMDRRPIRADPGHAMKTAIRYQGQDRAGRFGRDVHAAPADGQTGKAGTAMWTDSGDEGFETAVYEVDADAVASAILTRLFAGGTLPGPPSDRR